MKQLSALIVLLICSITVQAQISGQVTDNQGMPLPYVNIFVKGSSTGTTTNFEGQYQLRVETGRHTIVFQYIGYKTEEYTYEFGGEPLELNMEMTAAAYTMPEVVISAEAEDPAYAIIRKAQEMRRFSLDQTSRYSCDAYVRGFNKIYNAPEKIMGIEVGDMEGALDSTRQGVVYLSESVSRLHVSGSRSKEIMHSSKVSGDDQGYSFNSAQEMDFVFYNNYLDLNRKIVSPIAANAMNYYSYRLEGAKMDENGQLINKIKVIPKNEFDPCFAGYLYINEDLWNINSLELYVTSEATQLPFIDSLSFKQIYIPLREKQWMLLSNVIQFKMKAFGFELGGNFACVFSNYDLEEPDDDIFNREVYVVESEANTRSQIYWDSIRPIPLSREEKLDYIRKDSIRIVRESPEYLDSVDRESNRFKPLSVLAGYSRHNSFKRTQWTIETPISNLDVNTIQGWNGSVKLKFSKDYNKRKTRYFNAELAANYALSIEQFRPELRLVYQANRTNNLRFELSGGRSFNQFNRNDPITGRLNAIMTLFFRRNYLKAYDSYFADLSITRELGALFRVRASLNYEDRSALANTYDGSLFYKDSRTFTPNIGGFDDHQAFILRVSLRFRPGERIVRYPDRSFKTGSDWPTFWFHYKKGISSLAGSDVDYDLLQMTVIKGYSLGNKGEFNFYFNGGTFLNSPNFFVDAKHFLGNQTHIGYTGRYNYSFMLMPYYEYSTNEDFLQWHIQHSFDGYILGKIPLIRRLKWHLVGGHKYLLRKGDDYVEWHVGFDNIGYKLFRLFRVDAVWAKRLLAGEVNPSSEFNFGVVVGLKVKI